MTPPIGWKGQRPFQRFRVATHRTTNSCQVSGLGFRTNCLVGQALALYALQRNVGALAVIDAQLDAGVLAEIKFGQITVQVALLDALVGADQAALEDREKSFERIGVHVATRPFKLGMVHAFMAGNVRVQIAGVLVGHEAALFVDVFGHESPDAAMVDKLGADVTAALDKAHNNRIMGPAPEARRALGLARPRQFRLVGLNGLAFSTQRAAIGARSHRKADTVAKVPRGFHAAIEHPLDLTGGDAFLAGAYEVDNLQPQVQRQVAILKDGADPHRELALAGVALVQAGAGRLAIQSAYPRRLATMRADRAIRPKRRLDVGKSAFLGLKLRGGKNGLSHGEISYG